MNSWISTTLGELVDVLDSQRRPVNSEERSSRLGDVPYYGANGQQGWIDKPLFNEPLILLAEDGGNFDDFATRPIAYRIDGSSWVNNHAHIIRAKRGTDQSFLFWTLVHRDIRRFISGGTRTKLTQAEMRSIQLRVPVLSEQERIAQILDTMDDHIRVIEQRIAKLTRVRQGAMEAAFGRAVADVYSTTMAPVAKVLEHLIDFRGRTPKKLGLDWGGGRILALSANNVQMGRINTTREAYFGGERLYKAWMTHGQTRRGDILMTLEAPLGNVAQIPDDARYILSQRVVLLRFNEELVLNDFAYWFLRGHAFQAELVRHSTGTTASGIRRAELERLSLPLLPIREQRELADRFFAMQHSIDAETSGLAKLRAMKRGLMADLLTGRVRAALEAAS